MTDHVDLSALPKDAYVCMAQHGNCRRCGALEDLRMGSCFDCSEHVAGEAIPGGHRLWDVDNPSNTWVVMVGH